MSKEITYIQTVELTHIAHLSDEEWEKLGDVEHQKELIQKNMRAYLLADEGLELDDANVLSNKIFVRDVEDSVCTE